jgi:hypothetical protein
MAAGSTLCRIAELYQDLAAYFRSKGQLRLADTLERVYAFISRIGQCEVTQAQSNIVGRMQAIAPPVAQLGIGDVVDWLRLADELDTLLP